MWELIPFWHLEPVRVQNPIKLAYDVDKLDGWPVQFSSQRFNQLGQYTTSSARGAYCYVAARWLQHTWKRDLQTEGQQAEEAAAYDTVG